MKYYESFMIPAVLGNTGPASHKDKASNIGF